MATIVQQRDNSKASVFWLGLVVAMIVIQDGAAKHKHRRGNSP